MEKMLICSSASTAFSGQSATILPNCPVSGLNGNIAFSVRICFKGHRGTVVPHRHRRQSGRSRYFGVPRADSPKALRRTVADKLSLNVVWCAITYKVFDLNNQLVSIVWISFFCHCFDDWAGLLSLSTATRIIGWVPLWEMTWVKPVVGLGNLIAQSVR